ncbi:hypothetical protein [Cohnella nanjingensis]|uniref:Uncharacterized protein n=1 Tax=Cohnella nanjingensis TaxID=1387779 RepID=A0A7X0VHM5_9BACL|nr:hypothetical protein [Cohnella nanjingensis]MBB6672804.1 hypothetical protein [Cohnella nanjingensis]
MRNGIHGYHPVWHETSEALMAAEGLQLERLQGCRLLNVYSLWDVGQERWNDAAPFVFELDAFNLEVCHACLHALSVTVNAIDLASEPACEWRTGRPELSDFIGAFIAGLDLVEFGAGHAGGAGWMLHGIGFDTTKGYFAVNNGLDRNLIRIGKDYGDDIRTRIVF